MRVSVVTPADPVVSLADAKDHLKVDGITEDALIGRFVAAATGHLEEYTQRAIGRQVLEARWSTFESCWRLRLPRPPVASLLAVRWLDQSRNTVEGDLSDVELIDQDLYPIGEAPWAGMLVGRDALRVTYEAGYEQVPDDLRSAILLMTSFLYHNRGAQTAEPPVAVAVLAGPFRVFA